MFLVINQSLTSNESMAKDVHLIGYCDHSCHIIVPNTFYMNSKCKILKSYKIQNFV